MRHIRIRLRRLEGKFKNKQDTIQPMSPLEALQSINQIMKEYPDHPWNHLSSSERQRIYFKIPEGYSESEWYQIPGQKRAFILMDIADVEIQLQREVRTLCIKALANRIDQAREKEKKGF